MKNGFDRISDWTRRSVGLRMATITLLVLLLLIPLVMVTELISERQFRRDEAVNEISRSYSFAQEIMGPIISIPYTYKLSASKQEMTAYAHFLPENLIIKSSLDPEVRYRGIYQALLYKSFNQVSGSFTFPDIEKLGLTPDQMKWEEAKIIIGIPDVRGIQDRVKIKMGETGIGFQPGLPSRDLSNTGIQAPFPLDPNNKQEEIPFSLDLKLDGSKSISFIPVGRNTKIQLDAAWGTPKFFGELLPDERNIAKEMSSATWDIFDMNRTFPQEFVKDAYRLSKTSVGAELLVSVDEYKKNERTVKYGIMIIALTFMVFFFVEMLNKKRIHPIQYILVGLALVLFFVLLLSLSEQIGFQNAYIIAASSTITLVTVYMAGVFKNLKLTALTLGLMIVLYGFVYVIMQLEDFALLVGSIGLFIVLGIVMFITRNIDWYTISKPSTAIHEHE
ncbi:MAG: cell envelope integrity protein CreD [Bacteroidota bacterium]